MSSKDFWNLIEIFWGKGMLLGLKNLGKQNIYIVCVGFVLIISLVLFFLIKDTNKLSLVEPIDTSLENSSISMSFTIDKEGGYRAAFLFLWEEDSLKRRAQRETLKGGSLGEGVTIPVSLKLYKDGNIFFDDFIVTRGISGGQSMEHEDAFVTVGVRDIKHFLLPTGKYVLEIKTLQNTEKKLNYKSYIEFSYYDPKN